MIINDMSFEKFMEKFDKYFKDFIIRVRKGINESEVYYDGIESFIIKEYKKDLELKIPINVYKLNSTGFKNSSKNETDENKSEDNLIDLEKGQTREQKEKNYCIHVGNVLNDMYALFDFEMFKISFDIDFTEETDDKNKVKIKKITKIRNFYGSILRDFTHELKKHNKDKENLDRDILFEITNNKNDEIIYSNLYNKENFKESRAEFCNKYCNKFFGKVHFVLKFTPILSTKKEKRNSTPKDIIALQCWFLRKARKIKGVSGIKFDVKSTYIGEKYTTDKALEKFSKITANAIKNYKATSCKKLEKTYQHYFMLHAHEMEKLFDIKEGEKVDYFEQEYGIYNPNIYVSNNFKRKIKKDKTGRIDCIVYKYKENNNVRIITDIYMVELKVNRDVILGDNGVMTHLEDIKAFLNFDGNCNKKYKYYDYKTLEERIINRIKILSNEDTRFENVNKHFYTVIGHTKDEKIEDIKDMLKSLTTIDGVNEMIKIGKKNISGDNLKLNKRFEGTTLNNFYEETNKICDTKFFIEENIFDEKNIGLDFKDITKEIIN